MEQEFTKRTSVYSRRLRASTLVRLRWLAVVCQTLTVLFVALYLNYPMPVALSLTLIAASAWVNLYLSLQYSINHRLSVAMATSVLAFDIVQLALLLYLTGGLENPFAVLLIAPAIVSATSLPVINIIFLNILVVVSVSLLSFFALPLPWVVGEVVALPAILLDGIWGAIIATLLFTTIYVYYIAEEARRLADALNATELVLQHEKHLSALDGLAAAAAHELGTPLATIQLVVKEMYHGLNNDPIMREDLDLLTSQTLRCRNILKRLTNLSVEGQDQLEYLSLTELIEEVSEPLRQFDIDIIVQYGEKIGEEPMLKRNPGIVYGLGNLLENAVDFAKSKVIIEYKWNDNYVGLSIIDDGRGYEKNILDRIGEPYTTSRRGLTHEGNNDKRGKKGGGLGLGLFIAKTLLERSGAQLRFRNSPEKQLGAEVYLAWKRSNLL